MRTNNKKRGSGSLLFMLLLCITMISGCESGARYNEKQKAMEKWQREAGLFEQESVESLYKKALKEDILAVYTISTRAMEVKKSFEEEYPGLTVEVYDVRGTEIIDILKKNYETMNFACDVVICNDNNGALYEELIAPGILYPYLPEDIGIHMKEGHGEEQVYFVGEGQMIFYNNYDEPPISNIWEMTEKRFYEKIYVPNPFRSFSTYGFFATIMAKHEEMEAAYLAYAGEALLIPEGQTASEVFLEQLIHNIKFTNTSDEVVETIAAPGQTKPFIGIMISSKLRMEEIGYQMEPIYDLQPFAGTYCPNTVMMAGGAANVNTAKLFIRWLLGEADGSGKGKDPYQSQGTWSVRTDVKDGDDKSIAEIPFVWQEKAYINENKEYIDGFWTRLMSKISTE